MGRVEEDPIEAMMRKFRALCKFRMLGNLVMANLGWMSEGIGLSDGAAKLSRKKRLLLLEDKYLLQQHESWRSIQEKEFLYKILGGIKCFRQYPRHVRKELSFITYFKYYGSDRILARQGQESKAMYYVVSGVVEIIDKVYDPITKKWAQGVVAELKAGDEFGQDELLHNAVRPLTYRSKTGVELICILKEDFDRAIELTIRRHWDDIKRAMAQFTYFSTMSKEAILRGCLVAKLKTFHRTKTILGDGQGLTNFVYFILSGTCQLIDTLFVKQSTYIRKKIYTYYTPKEIQVSSKSSRVQAPVKTLFDDQEDEPRQIRATYEMLQELKLNVDLLSATSSNRKMDESDAESNVSSHHHFYLPEDVNVHFMQVCLMNAGGCFGWEDKYDNRRMIALSDVKCLLLPKTWIWMNNPYNLWYRIKHYYDMHIPSRREMFDLFVINRRWDEHKKAVVDEINKGKKAVNWTRQEDVPYSINIKENLYLKEDCDL